jgi:hypothetical protein
VLLAGLLARRGEKDEARRLVREALPALRSERDRATAPHLRDFWSGILKRAETVLAEH